MKKSNISKSIVLYTFFCFVISCKTIVPLTLTPEQEAIKIFGGTQNETIELMKIYESIGMEDLSSEFQARVKAVSLNADAAQLLYKSGYTYTYRFWRKKE